MSLLRLHEKQHKCYLLRKWILSWDFSRTHLHFKKYICYSAMNIQCILTRPKKKKIKFHTPGTDNEHSKWKSMILVLLVTVVKEILDLSHMPILVAHTELYSPCVDKSYWLGLNQQCEPGSHIQICAMLINMHQSWWKKKMETHKAYA